MFDRNTTTPARASTTTDANGLWSISHATEGRFDVRITNGSSVRFHKYDAQSQISTLEVASFRIRNPANTFEYDIVPAAIVADRQLNLPLITGTDTLAVLGLAQTFTAAHGFANDIIFSLGTGGDIAFVDNSAGLSANTALTSVLIGTPVTPAIAADSFILSNTTASGDILVAGNLGGNSRAYVFVDVSADTFDLMTAGVSRIRLGAAGLVAINDTSNADMTIGLTINQGAADNIILAMKSSDVAHGMTTFGETDTYAQFGKAGPTTGGAELDGLGSGSTGILMKAFGATDTTAKTTGAGAYFYVYSAKASGAGVTSPGADANLVAFGENNGGSTRFIFDVEGSAHADIEWVAFDSYDDLALIHDIEQHLLDRESAVGTYNRHALEAAGIIGRDSWHFERGKPRAMVNMTKLAMLHHGALMQAGSRIAALEREVTDLRRALPA